MSTSGLSGKLHGEKSTASGGKKYQAVNINSVYSGKSLVGQKASAAPKHGGLQSLGKATAVARRMPPPANLPSLKSESAGQEQAVNIVPTGVQGWGTQQQSTTATPLDVQDTKSLFDAGNKKVPSDGISLRPAGPPMSSKAASTTVVSSGASSATAASSPVQSTATSAAVSQTATSTTSGRPTWSTRIGTNSNNYFAQTAQDYPKLMNEESGDGKGSAAPSLRPQRSGNWKSGGGHGLRQGSESPTPPSLNGRERSRSASPASTDHRPPPPPMTQPAEQLPPYGQTGYGPRQAQYPPGPFSYPPHPAYPPTLYPPPGGPRGGAAQAPTFPPQFPDYRYGPAQGGPPPRSVMMQGRYGPGQGPPMPSQSSQKGAPNRARQGDGSGDHVQVPPHPPDHYRGGAPVARGNDYSMPYGRDYGPPMPRDPHGDHWSVPPAQYYHPREQDMRRNENAVWSDDEAEDRDRRYGRGDMRRNKTDKQHAWSDSEERYGDEWTRYDGARDGASVPPGGRQHPAPPNARVGSVYPPPPPPGSMKQVPYTVVPPVGPMMHGRDNRYGPPPPPMAPVSMQQRYPPYGPGYMPPHYDQRHMGHIPPHMNYGQPPHHYMGRERGPHDIEAEEEEEIARQQQQQYARDAAMERSKQKRLQGQQPPAPAASGDRYGGRDELVNEEYDDSEADRSSSRESYGNKPNAKRPQPQMAPRLVQGDGRSGMQHPYSYGRPYPHGSQAANQYESSQVPPPHMGQGDGNYYEKRSPRQAGPHESPNGPYDNAKRYEPPHYRSDKRKHGQNESESDAGRSRKDQCEDAPTPTETRDKQLKRPDSKESLSSDRSNGRTDKVAPAAKLWPRETHTVKEVEPKAQDLDDTEEDQKFETLSKPTVVVKRTMPQATAEKPQEPEKKADSANAATKMGTQASITSDTKALSKASTATQAVAVSKKDDKHMGSGSMVGQKSQSQQSIQQQQAMEDQTKKNVWEQRKEQFEKQDSVTDSKDDKSEEDKGDGDSYENWGSSSVSGRGGRGVSRGRGLRREFVSSRRMHGHSIGGISAGVSRRGGPRTGSTWEKEPESYGRRRGGSEDYVTKTKEGTSKVEDSSVAESLIDKVIDDERKERGRAKTEEDEQSGPGSKSSRGATSHGRGAKRGSSSGYGTEQDWSRQYGQSAGHVYNRSRGGSAYAGYRGYEGDYYEDDDGQYDYYDYRRHHQNTGRLGSSRGVGRAHQRSIPPRFQEHDKSGHGSGYSQYHSTRRTMADTRSRNHAAQSAKSPVVGMKRENQSEGNDEWETASESSDVGERNKQDNENEENWDRKKQSSGPKSFSGQRRAPDRRRGGGSYVGHTSAVGTDLRGSQYRRTHQYEHYPSANGNSGQGQIKGEIENAPGSANDQEKVSSHSKNAIVASHHSTSNNMADPKITSDITAQNVNRKQLRKDEKPAAKSGALATVDINNIAGVVVIDDQPDVVVATENQDGFQEVVSKKRLKKDIQPSDEKDRKSQSPSNRTRLQPHSGSIGSKTEKNPKKSSNANQPASVSATASARSSAGDSTGGIMTGNPWERKTNQQTSAAGNANVFANRLAQNSDHQHYRPNMNHPEMIATSASIGLSNISEAPGGQASNIPSKTGVEIWGTPDPMPFSGANDQAIGNKYVARPAKTTVSEMAVRPKSVEFMADSLNKVNDDAGVKLDFTFDASLGPFRDSKQNAVDPRNTDLGLDSDSVDNSPSADQLSEKIASVKKVWDKVHPSMSGNELKDSAQQSGAPTFFGAASDAETAAIVSSAASLVSAAVLQSVHVDQTSSHAHHPSGYDGEANTKQESNGPGQTTASAASSSKAEGPNVAKVRPQQMLIEQQSVTQMVIGQDDFTNSGISMNMGYASGASTPLYAFTGANNSSLFSAQFTGKSDFGLMNPAAQSPLSSYASFATAPATGAAPPNRSVFGQQTTFMLPPTAVTQSMEQLRNSFFPAADQNLLFGGAAPASNYVSQQPIRSHSAVLPNQQATLSKASSMAMYGNVQGSYVLPDGSMSLFSHPPPPFGSLSAQQGPAPGASAALAAAAAMVAARATPGAPTQQTPSSTGGFDFSQPPPTAVSINQPPPVAPVLQAHILQTGALNMPPPPGATSAKMANLASLPNQSPFGWGGNVATTQQKPPPSQQQGTSSIMSGGRKVFNPTIGPPTSQKVSGAAAATAILGMAQPPMASMGHMFGTSVGAAGLIPCQPLSISTNQGHNFGRRGVPGGNGQGQSGKPVTVGQSGGSIDQSKRDGDLLQQMDKFINSTQDDDIHGNCPDQLADSPNSSTAAVGGV